MKLASFAASLCLTSLCGIGREPAAVFTRRAALAAAGGLAASGAAPVNALDNPMGKSESSVDDEWTKHEGPFDDAFFSDFTVSKAESSFKYKFIRDGEGGPKPVPFQKVSVSYRGYLLDGTLVDSSYGRGKPFSFRLGKGKVITGW
jgi:FKBP-type peptidyl-prolyl cis-trans isomerase